MEYDPSNTFKKKIDSCVEIARALRPNKSSGPYFHTTFIFKNNKLLSIGMNSYRKPHPIKRYGKYRKHKDIAGTYHANLHSEVSALLKLGDDDCSQYSFLNIGFSRSGDFCDSKPCENCARVLAQVGFKKIYWMDRNGCINIEN